MVEKIQRKVRIHTHQQVVPELPPVQEGFPMRRWSVDIQLLNAEGESMPANVFDKVTYKLHPTFENPTRVMKQPPFKLEEQGWGEFEMQIVLTLADRGGDQTVRHDLNFLSEDYNKDITVSFPANKPKLVSLLAESGPVPSAGQAATPAAPANGAAVSTTPVVGDKRSAVPGSSEEEKRAKKPKVAVKGSVDLERLAQGMEKLGEQDVLSIVQMISDNKTPDIYVKNDAEAGEFHVDLFTLPNGLLKSMWEFVSSRVEV